MPTDTNPWSIWAHRTGVAFEKLDFISMHPTRAERDAELQRLRSEPGPITYVARDPLDHELEGQPRGPHSTRNPKP